MSELISELYNYQAQTLDGKSVSLRDYAGKVLLIVNTASKCGFTPQFEGLQKLHQDYAAQGLVIIGFPCNQFGGQEPGDSAEIGAFCSRNYGVDFLMMEKIEVNGAHTHPLYTYLKQAAPGFLGTQRIKWNFTKFLINRDDTSIKRFAPNAKPALLESSVQRLLGS